MTTSIISQRQTLVAIPPLRRGRHSTAYVHSLPPSRIELVNRRVRSANQRAARLVADRMRPAHLNVVRARAARWSAIAVPVAIYAAVVLAVIPGVR